jgi:hypothetical protein
VQCGIVLWSIGNIHPPRDYDHIYQLYMKMLPMGEASGPGSAEIRGSFRIESHRRSMRRNCSASYRGGDTPLPTIW